MELSAYRTQAETFVRELGEAYHGHYAGLSDAFAIDAIYARHAALFSFEAVAALRGRVAAASDAPGVRDDEARQLRMLLDFAVEGLLGRATAAEEEALAQREATLRLDLPGGPLGFRASTVAQANSPDRQRRAEIEAARLKATERELNPLHRAALERTRALVAELGWPSYRAMCAELKGWDLDLLGRQGDAFLAATGGAAYGAVVGPALERTVGVGLDRLARADLPWFFRATADDGAFPADGLLEAYASSCRGLGLSPDGGGRIDLDVEPRPRKSPRAFCVAVRAPADVRLVVAPVGGRDDYAALLHEGGHAQHFAAMDAALPFEYRHLGDNALTEAFAFLFDHLVEDPRWLAARGVRDDDGALAMHARAARLIYLRRYCGKLAYELIVHDAAAPGDALLGEVYARSLSGAVGVAWPAETHLSDLDPGFYVAAYLRAWALETHLRRWLTDRFGDDWFSSAEAGAALRALWAEGQRRSAEELLAELTGERLDLAVLATDLGL
ncbi:hypothetical protein Q5424_21040 [Conexibacter sp. JD483]|uniref:hypothetical protein n=1 Tax=unclassified Conexibacter TaxID=2627773 RepID=UPI00271756DE|nr:MULTISPECIES: hypothetical protein [unclassified Conexibacter]MDO8187017.1 hypothetical protein [Conexibacter sp. CPCC 205706]MDO8200665.1 hypothetical protein [Conexibacter sp. CPCC 205762]MDR9371599.1 hypothetical protein [Conexibacter sp. JD483]